VLARGMSIPLWDPSGSPLIRVAQMMMLLGSRITWVAVVIDKEEYCPGEDVLVEPMKGQGHIRVGCGLA